MMRCDLTDNEKLLSIGNFIYNEGWQLEEHCRVVFHRRLVCYRECDQLDLLELIQLMDRWEYFKELSTVIENILYDRHSLRPQFHPLTGWRYPDIM